MRILSGKHQPEIKTLRHSMRETAALADGTLVKTRRRIGRKQVTAVLAISILIGIDLGALAAYLLRSFQFGF